MKFSAAQKVKVGDKVQAPKIGALQAVKIEQIVEDADPRVKLLFQLEGQEHLVNFKLIEIG